MNGQQISGIDHDYRRLALAAPQMSPYERLDTESAQAFLAYVNEVYGTDIAVSCLRPWPYVFFD